MAYLEGSSSWTVSLSKLDFGEIEPSPLQDSMGSDGGSLEMVAEASSSLWEAGSTLFTGGFGTAVPVGWTFSKAARRRLAAWAFFFLPFAISGLGVVVVIQVLGVVFSSACLGDRQLLAVLCEDVVVRMWEEERLVTFILFVLVLWMHSQFSTLHRIVWQW